MSLHVSYFLMSLSSLWLCLFCLSWLPMFSMSLMSLKSLMSLISLKSLMSLMTLMSHISLLSLMSLHVFSCLSYPLWRGLAWRGVGEGVGREGWGSYQFIFFSSSQYLYIFLSLYPITFYLSILHLKRTHLLDISWPCFLLRALFIRTSRLRCGKK